VLWLRFGAEIGPAEFIGPFDTLRLPNLPEPVMV
jgi:hypothetical protein